MKGRVLIIAGSDPSGGAGIQADIKTVTALGGYAATAITALTVQNTKGVSAVHAVAPEIIRAQIEAVMSDIGADAIKIGMIGDVSSANAIIQALRSSGWDYRGGHFGDNAPLVLDPVLTATSGDALSEETLAGFIEKKILPLSYLVTPNTMESEQLTGIKINSIEKQRAAGVRLLELGAETALVKGGHLKGEFVEDVLTTHSGEHVFSHSRIETSSTHGTGCTLASAIATGLAQGVTLPLAVKRAVAYVQEAIRTAPGYGAGHGPLNHGHTVKVDEDTAP